MHDKLGIYLQNKRNNVAIPNIQGLLLDIGCGTNSLVKKYGNGVGVDVYPWDGIDVLVKNSAKLPFKDDTFQTVTIIAALNHIPNRYEVLREAHRLLKTNGILIITMIPPHLSKVWHIVRSPWDLDQSERGMEPGELYGMPNNEIKKIITDAGFSIVTEKRFMLFINTLTVARKENP